MKITEDWLGRYKRVREEKRVGLRKLRGEVLKREWIIVLNILEKLVEEGWGVFIFFGYWRVGEISGI